jgi:hypothetical protein
MIANVNIHGQRLSKMDNKWSLLAMRVILKNICILCVIFFLCIVIVLVSIAMIKY